MSSVISNYRQQLNRQVMSVNIPNDSLSSPGSNKNFTFDTWNPYNGTSYHKRIQCKEPIPSSINKPKCDSSLPLPASALAPIKSKTTIMSIKEKIEADDEFFMPFIPSEHEESSSRDADHCQTATTHPGSPFETKDESTVCDNPEDESNSSFVHKHTARATSKRRAEESPDGNETIESGRRMKQKAFKNISPSDRHPSDGYNSVPHAPAPQVIKHYHYHCHHHIYHQSSVPQPDNEGSWCPIPTPPPLPAMATSPIPQTPLLSAITNLPSPQAKSPPFVEFYLPSPMIGALRRGEIPPISPRQPSSRCDPNRPIINSLGIILSPYTPSWDLKSYLENDSGHVIHNSTFTRTKFVNDGDIVKVPFDRNTGMGIPFKKGVSVIGQGVVGQGRGTKRFDPTIRPPSKSRARHISDFIEARTKELKRRNTGAMFAGELTASGTSLKSPINTASGSGFVTGTNIAYLRYDKE